MVRKLYVIAALIFCAFLNAAAQETTFQEEDLKNLIKTASGKLEGTIHRVKSVYTTFTYKSSIPDSTIKTTREVVPPDRWRSVYERETSEGIKRLERISIGAKRFERSDNGDWKDVSGVGSGEGMGSGTGIGGTNLRIEKNIERKLTKGEFVNNKKVDRYETIITIKYTTSIMTMTTVSRSAYWFDADGMYVKIESESSTDGNRAFSHTFEYEYDPNIKIEAPIVGATTKP